MGSDYAITKRVLVSEQDWDKAVQIADENGFRNSNISRRGNTEGIVARIILVIIVILFIIFILNMTGCSNEKTNTVSETEPINPTTEILTETETVTTSVVTETSRFMDNGYD